MTRTPTFSIITISYQNISGLTETLDSVARQTTQDYEHFVIDGGSTDGSREWLESSFSGEWVSEKDDGRYAAMNKGAAMARGEYLWFLHAGDTLCRKDVLETARGYLTSSPAWAYGLARVVSPEKELVGTIGYVPFKMFNFAVLGHPLPHQATLIRRDVFENLGGYDLTVPVAADQFFMLRAAHYEAPLPIPEFLCDFDSTGLSAGRSWLHNYADSEKNRRQFLPTTKWRTLDTVISFGYAGTRQLVRRASRDANSTVRRGRAHV